MICCQSIIDQCNIHGTTGFIDRLIKDPCTTENTLQRTVMRVISMNKDEHGYCLHSIDDCCAQELFNYRCMMSRHQSLDNKTKIRLEIMFKTLIALGLPP